MAIFVHGGDVIQLQGGSTSVAPYLRLLREGYPVSRRLVTTTPYPAGRMYQPPGSPEPMTDMVFHDGDTIIVTFPAVEQAPGYTGRTLVQPSFHVRDLFHEGFTAEEMRDNPYPCQLCWATARWPWEPLRACPLKVDPESTLCARHR